MFRRYVFASALKRKGETIGTVPSGPGGVRRTSGLVPAGVGTALLLASSTYYDPQDRHNTTLRPRTYGMTVAWRK